ncbi:MAG: molybdopterin cofactor-binding domain-containing protein, partial [Candidatus Binatota bacterium]
RYESCFIRERLLDMVAADLNIDPAELRLKNLIQPTEMPYVLGVTRRGESPTVFDSGDYPMALKRALEKIGYGELRQRQGRYEEGKYHGIGIGCYVKNTGRGPFECARVEVRSGNSIAVYIGLASLGQGHETTMAQICADTLGVPIEQITVFHGSTDLLPFGGGTNASRGTVMGGNAVYLAAQEVKRKVLTIAGSYLGVAPSDLELRDGQVHGKGAETEKPLLSLEDVVPLAAPTSRFNPLEPGLDATAYFKSDQMTYTYGAHVAHVAVDPETGKVEVLRYVAVQDVGRCVNPLLLHGQIVGGVAQGIGATLLEDLVYSENGQLLTTTFMDYLLPTSTVVPPIEAIILEEAPSPLNPLGVKGGGEETSLATGATLANAVANALSSFSVKATELPLSHNRVREWIRRHK